MISVKPEAPQSSYWQRSLSTSCTPPVLTEPPGPLGYKCKITYMHSQLLFLCKGVQQLRGKGGEEHIRVGSSLPRVSATLLSNQAGTDCHLRAVCGMQAPEGVKKVVCASNPTSKLCLKNSFVKK